MKRIGGVEVRVVVPLQRTPKRQVTEEYLPMHRGVSEAERIDEDKISPCREGLGSRN